MKIKRIDYSNRFIKGLRKAPLKIKIALRQRLELFTSDKFHPVLNNHALTSKYKGYRSINVTGDWRVIFREFNKGEIVYFEVIGTHSQLYNK